MSAPQTLYFRSPVSRPGAGQDFIDFFLIDRKLPLKIRIEKMKPIISPEDLAIHYKARNAKHASLDCTLCLETKPVLDFNCAGLFQKLLPLRPLLSATS